MAVYDDSVDDQIRELYESGLYSSEQVAEIVGCSRWMVLNHARRMGIEIRPRGTSGHTGASSRRLPHNEIFLTRQLLKKYQSYQKVAELTGRPRGAVYNMAKRYGFLL